MKKTLIVILLFSSIIIANNYLLVPYANALFNFGIVSSTNLWKGPSSKTLEGQITELYLSARFRMGEHFLKVGFSEDLSVNRVADFNLFFEITPIS